MNVKNPLLRRFWFRFAPSESLDPRLTLGCGVTAYDLEDARRVLRERVFAGAALPPIAEVIEDIDIASLDAEHIRPNMGVPIWRGVWFPRGEP